MLEARFNGSLMPHQQLGVDWIMRTPNALLADDVGLGKTAQALAALNLLIQQGHLPHRAPGRPRLCRVLWVTDASLIEQTRLEANRFLPHLSVLAGSDPEFGSTAKGQERMRRVHAVGVDLVILSYEMATSRREWLTRFSPPMLVMDEVSNLKGKGKQFEALCGLSGQASRVLSMTATPLENDPTELWAILRATNTPALWSEEEFSSRFVTWRVAHTDNWGREHLEATGWQESSLTEVRAYLGQHVLRRTVDDLGGDRRLPSRVGPEHRTVPLTAAQKCSYERAQAQTRRDAVRRMEIASLFGGENPPMVRALLDELGKSTESAIVYCEALEMLDLVEARLAEAGITCSRIEGKVKAADRHRAIERHRTGEARVLLASRVLEYGLNLQHCRLLYSLDSSWNPARESQREGRIRRLGSPHPTYQHLVIRPETALADSKSAKLARKARAAELVGLA